MPRLRKSQQQDFFVLKVPPRELIGWLSAVTGSEYRLAFAFCQLASAINETITWQSLSTGCWRGEKKVRSGLLKAREEHASFQHPQYPECNSTA